MSERYAVQNPMIRYAQQIGWAYARPDEALRLRGGETGRFFVDVLVAQLLALNPGVVDVGRATIQGNLTRWAGCAARVRRSCRRSGASATSR